MSEIICDTIIANKNFIHKIHKRALYLMRRFRFFVFIFSVFLIITTNIFAGFEKITREYYETRTIHINPSTLHPDDRVKGRHPDDIHPGVIIGRFAQNRLLARVANVDEVTIPILVTDVFTQMILIQVFDFRIIECRTVDFPTSYILEIFGRDGHRNIYYNEIQIDPADQTLFPHLEALLNTIQTAFNIGTTPHLTVESLQLRNSYFKSLSSSLSHIAIQTFIYDCLDYSDKKKAKIKHFESLYGEHPLSHETRTLVQDLITRLTYEYEQLEGIINSISPVTFSTVDNMHCFIIFISQRANSFCSDIMEMRIPAFPSSSSRSFIREIPPPIGTPKFDAYEERRIEGQVLRLKIRMLTRQLQASEGVVSSEAARALTEQSQDTSDTLTLKALPPPKSRLDSARLRSSTEPFDTYRKLGVLDNAPTLTETASVSSVPDLSGASGALTPTESLEQSWETIAEEELGVGAGRSNVASPSSLSRSYSALAVIRSLSNSVSTALSSVYQSLFKASKTPTAPTTRSATSTLEGEDELERMTQSVSDGLSMSRPDTSVSIASLTAKQPHTDGPSARKPLVRDVFRRKATAPPPMSVLFAINGLIPVRPVAVRTTDKDAAQKAPLTTSFTSYQ